MIGQSPSVPSGSDTHELPTFSRGRKVRLVRKLSGLPTNSEGIIRGVSASATGIKYVVRFAALTRVVAEQDLAPTLA